MIDTASIVWSVARQAGLTVSAATSAPTVSQAQAIAIAERGFRRPPGASVFAANVIVAGTGPVWLVVFSGVPMHSHMGTARQGLGYRLLLVDARTGALVRGMYGIPAQELPAKASTASP